MRQAIKRALPVFAAFAGASFIGTALAASQRTFVASTGVDTNACSISAPCRSFSAAIAKTSAPGEVIVLDSAGYGPVTIDKSISLIAPAGIHAGVTVFSGDGITVDAPGSTVLLRGLSINGHGGVTGVNVLQVTRVANRELRDLGHDRRWRTAWRGRLGSVCRRHECARQPGQWHRFCRPWHSRARSRAQRRQPVRWPFRAVLERRGRRNGYAKLSRVQRPKRHKRRHQHGPFQPADPGRPIDPRIQWRRRICCWTARMRYPRAR